MGYSACFTIDVNMFWIFIFGFFQCSHKQLCLIKFLIFCTNSLSLSFIFWFHCSDLKKPQSLINMTVLLIRGGRGQVDVTLHGRQGFDFASRPSSFPLPQTARRANAKPAISASFANDPFVVVDVGDASHCDHAGLQHLRGPHKRALTSKPMTVFIKINAASSHLNLLLWRELNNRCSVYFTEQNSTCTWEQNEPQIYKGFISFM